MAVAALGDSHRAWELFALINPISHPSSSDQVARRKVEPNVVAADVYAVTPHTTRVRGRSDSVAGSPANR
jgi:cellobiose phosphorylase